MDLNITLDSHFSIKIGLMFMNNAVQSRKKYSCDMMNEDFKEIKAALLPSINAQSSEILYSEFHVLEAPPPLHTWD